ncbi:MAG: poly(ethylene terephthalate) hydrolase family protein, partial [Deltaproteobacteria bacterium]
FPAAAAGPFPVVLFAHGYDIDASAYYDYGRHLASFGYVVVWPDFPSDDPLSPNHVADMHNVIAGLDWAESSGTDGGVAALVDPSLVGISGHSLGGKLAILAAASDPRFRASITFDAVDGSTNCTPTNCPNAVDVLPLPIPTGFLGETGDGTGAYACAPLAENYDTLFQKAETPSLELTVAGAGHASFVDSLSVCGFACSFCGSRNQPQTLAISHATLVAFYERYLRGNTGYDAWLTGSLAQSAWVATQEATLTSK